jgi:hypothetical protein
MALNRQIIPNFAVGILGIGAGVVSYCHGGEYKSKTPGENRGFKW